MNRITRRDFLKLTSLGSLFMLNPSLFEVSSRRYFSSILIDKLPSNVIEIFQKVPHLRIDPRGYLCYIDETSDLLSRIPIIQTAWNKERMYPSDRLRMDMPWAIVLHWFGDRGGSDMKIDAYLRGFDDVRKIEDYETKTSAHFLVGDQSLKTALEGNGSISILQVQKPDQDGVPFLASHLRSLSLGSYHEGTQYFLKALYELRKETPAIRGGLIDFYERPNHDINSRTIGIEITGFDFDNPARYPSNQKIANVLGLVWALMIRYRIPAEYILGHNELQLNKPDPGKKFLALIRYLLGVYTLIQDNRNMNELVFGMFRSPNEDDSVAIAKYFKFVRHYLALVSIPQRVFEWEIWSGYWQSMQAIGNTPGEELPDSAMEHVAPLFDMEVDNPMAKFLEPPNHRGIDLVPKGNLNRLQNGLDVRLLYPGRCLFVGTGKGEHPGMQAIFRHRTVQGGEFISIYDGLKDVTNIKVNQLYPPKIKIGSVKSHQTWEKPFVHLGFAYASYWDYEYKFRTSLPMNVGRTWIMQRYMNPEAMIPDINQLGISIEQGAHYKMDKFGYPNKYDEPWFDIIR
ncbi:MAG: N-acetylmuramoyl-L-alanine amidase [Anaerolineales bacterium]|nr:N-acetylmuramoyl-L-alanine amidase [Anaerolineales bacterium]